MDQNRCMKSKRTHNKINQSIWIIKNISIRKKQIKKQNKTNKQKQNKIEKKDIHRMLLSGLKQTQQNQNKNNELVN